MVLVHDICWRKCREPRILVNRLLEKVPALQSKTELRCKTHKMNCIKFRLYLRYICNYIKKNLKYKIAKFKNVSLMYYKLLLEAPQNFKSSRIPHVPRYINNSI
jgi:hypothetical protein